MSRGVQSAEIEVSIGRDNACTEQVIRVQESTYSADDEQQNCESYNANDFSSHCCIIDARRKNVENIINTICIAMIIAVANQAF